MTKQKVKWQVVVAVIAAITILEAIALFKGIDGKLLTIVIGVLAVMAGIVIPTPKVLK